jgi:hypothetical protein
VALFHKTPIMKFTPRLVLILFGNSLFCQEVPKLLTSTEYETENISTDEGDFTAWIVEDDGAKKLHRQVKRLEKLEVDRSDDFLIFSIYTDGDYEYVVAKQKLKYRKMKFFRITVYTI